MPTAHDVLSSKGSTRVLTISPAASVLDAVEKMNELKVGSLIVMEDGQVLGIFSERDVLRRVIGETRKPSTTTVSEVMTRDVVCVEPDADLDEVSTLMKERRIRHVPVCDPDRGLIGLVSIGDVNAYHASNREATLHYLNEYIYGRV
ncbi:MAG TPA: CBS domain-containing protein [Tepidisphaeraceae bacterium]|nr:CBS domain-containing protein [Tepidisphaeraceae bacterium]